ncbi:hypothetical protein BESB_055980 [Besnoitia besnoiti]|uniref:RNA-binding S4 domain-containing protein n=1 Tax=Besnoitia besnoiti TaxID=94643 RepID=A0A2A9MK18_BESBE|nr:hypothetical protein BESB_055980 [Besnoitia besnoiti]PFH35947.1 hypothetical protein BESB_055980 [Besnoitia besnoiti]
MCSTLAEIRMSFLVITLLVALLTVCSEAALFPAARSRDFLFWSQSTELPAPWSSGPLFSHHSPSPPGVPANYGVPGLTQAAPFLSFVSAVRPAGLRVIRGLTLPVSFSPTENGEQTTPRYRRLLSATGPEIYSLRSASNASWRHLPHDPSLLVRSARRSLQEREARYAHSDASQAEASIDQYKADLCLTTRPRARPRLAGDLALGEAEGSPAFGHYCVPGSTSSSTSFSERLDRSLSKHLNISRTLTALHFIRGRRVRVNGTTCTAPGRRLRNGDKVWYSLASIKEHEETQKRGTPGKDIDVDMLLEEASHEEAVDLKEGGVAPDARLPSTEPVERVSTATSRMVQSPPAAHPGGSAAGAEARLRAAVGVRSLSTELRDEFLGRRKARVDQSSLALMPDPTELSIIFEDDDIVVINKPAGLLTHPPTLTVRNIDKHNRLGSVVQRLFYKFLCSDRGFPETFLPLAKQAAFSSLAREASGRTLVRRTATSTTENMSAAYEQDSTTAADGLRESVSTQVLGARLGLPVAISRPSAVVHRLDIGTSGVLVAAKTFAAAENLKYQWAQRKVVKGYIGLCTPEMHWLHEVDAPIRRHPTMRGKMEAVAIERSPSILMPASSLSHDKRAFVARAKPGFTVFAPLGGNGDCGLFAALALTGRTHQIRAHLEYIGHPLMGDPVYGNRARTHWFPFPDRPAADAPRPAKLATRTRGKGAHSLNPDADSAFFQSSTEKPCVRPFLHAYLLRFDHPGNGAPMEFKAEPPADICSIARRMGVDWASSVEAAFRDIGSYGGELSKK